jgi:hypothetical protein
MAYEESIRSISLAADSSLAVYTGVPGLPGSASPNAGRQYRFVKVTGTRQVGLCTAATDNAIGVMQSKPQNTGMAATVAIRGVSYVVSGAGAGANAIAAGASVTSDSEGRAVKLPGTGSPVAHGVALVGSTTAGELIPVLIKG